MHWAGDPSPAYSLMGTVPGSVAVPEGGAVGLVIAVIGAGYVGLVQAGGLVRLGHRVRVGEKDPSRLRGLRLAELPIYEPGLDALIAEGVSTGRLSFHASNREAVRGADVVFVTLPTPSAPDGSVDTTILHDAVERLAGTLEGGAVLAIKSTVPVGTARQIAGLPVILDRDVRVVSNPEFLRGGSAVHDFLHPDRIVIGAEDPGAVDLLVSAVYRGLGGDLVVTDPASAEMIKYAANSYLATRLGFANSIANLCEAVGADAAEVLGGMGRDHRIGPHYLQPGPGYGGSCLPKDTRALLSIADQSGYDFVLLRAAMEVNDLQRRRIVEKVESAAGGSLQGSVIGLWGLAFKADTDDTRESPAVDLAERLLACGAVVQAYDPKVNAPISGVIRAGDAVSAASGADVLLVATEWKEFREVDLSEVRGVMRGSAVVDARNLLDPAVVEAHGLAYVGVGSVT